jgi:dienelactone hydrolase
MSKTLNHREMSDSVLVDGRTVGLEVFIPDRQDPHPAVLVLHGADGPHRKAEEYRQVCQHLVSLGYTAVRVFYFEAGPPDSPPQEHLANPLAHMAWLKGVSAAHDYAAGLPHVMAHKIAIVGFSLGGYVGLAAAALDGRYAALVEFFGGVPEMVMQMIDRMPPTLILHGEADVVVPVSEARKIEKIFKLRKMEYEMHVYPGEGHNFSPPARNDSLARVGRFLKQHLDS